MEHSPATTPATPVDSSSGTSIMNQMMKLMKACNPSPSFPLTTYHNLRQVLKISTKVSFLKFYYSLVQPHNM